jgi:membrane fusion protein, copper/silver efflux system
VPVRLEETRESSVSGQAVVKVTEGRQQLIGVKIGEVKKRSFVKDIRTVGRVAYDPELYRAQEEYLGALLTYERVRGSSLPEAVERAKSLLESSRLRLRLQGLSDGQIDRLSRREGPDTSLLLSKSQAGTVWLYAEVYESELPFVKAGQIIEARTLAQPDIVFRGRIKAIDSVIDPKTRSARARAEIENQDGILKPDMYLNARIKVDMGERLTVPESAVMDSGTRRIVFVAEGDGFFEPREVVLGAKSEDYYQVKSGLVEGEKVVTSGNFLIDSESKLKASLSALSGGHQH